MSSNESSAPDSISAGTCTSGSQAQGGYFTSRLSGDDYLWTAGFFNERFPDVVSPLGWSVVRRLVEPSAFREPLNFIGYILQEDFPLTKLYQGHVYTNVGVFQRLYRVFPRFAISRDAGRYFPRGDVSLRYAVPPPNPVRFLSSVVHTLLSEPGWHPLNFLAWRRFVSRFDRETADSFRRIEAESRPAALLREVTRLIDASLCLLRLHRWSLTYADVLYDLLRRLVSAWVDAEHAGELCATLTSGLPNKSTETDLALWRLTKQAADLEQPFRDCLHAERFDALLEELDESSGCRRFRRAFDDFLARYGHRSPNLDLRYPAYADDPAQALAVVAHLLDADEDLADRVCEQDRRRRTAVARVRETLCHSPIRWSVFRVLLWFTQRYTILRENQRFYWQKSMHAKRRALVRIGQSLAASGALRAEDDVFFLTLSEVSGVVRGWLAVPEILDLIAGRRAQFENLRGAPYPDFLRGQVPLSEAGGAGDGPSQHLEGLAASPGRVRGAALVVGGPTALADAWRRVSSEHILVTSSTDPAWTPLFLRVSGLVMERGGQLSHGAVVAREYGLPAVVGVAGALDRIADGQLIEIDGSTGTVTLLWSAHRDELTY